MWLLLLFIHVFALTGFNLSIRKSLLNKVDQLTLIVIMQTGLAIPAVFLFLFRPPDLGIYETRDYLMFLVLICLTVGLHVTNVRALKYLEAGVFSVLYNLRILITTILGILFLSEDLIWTRILGGMLILLAIFIVRQKGSKTIRLRGIEWGIIAAFTISLLNMTEKIMINNVGILNYFSLLMIVTALLMWAYILLIKKPIDRKMLFHPQMVRLMAFRSVSAYAFTTALAAGALVSVANYISSMSVILMVALGVVLLNERDYLKRKIAATTVAVIGMTIVLLSNLQ